MDESIRNGPASQAFPRSHRITSRRDFVRTYEKGEKIFGRHLVVFASSNDLGVPRLGITVTRKVGKSVVRNKLKRRVREIFRVSRSTTGLTNRSVDVVVNLKSSARDASFEELASDLTKVLRRIAVRPPAERKQEGG